MAGGVSLREVALKAAFRQLPRYLAPLPLGLQCMCAINTGFRDRYLAEPRESAGHTM
jgi:hypothetical protein